MKILIAENDRQTDRNIRMAFEMCLPDSEFITTHSFKGCMGSIKEAHPDMVILGELDDMSSLDTIAQIRCHSEVPVMALSYNRDSSFVVGAFNAGADGVMNQPGHHLELVARTKAILRRKKGVKALTAYSAPVTAGETRVSGL